MNASQMIKLLNAYDADADVEDDDSDVMSRTTAAVQLEEMATAMGISKMFVWARRVAAQKRLRTFCEEWGVEPPESDPEASDYRLSKVEIDADRCTGRLLNGMEDKAWKPVVYAESQCTRKPVEGSDMCKVCNSRQDKANADPEKSARIGWNGRVTEDPPGWCHMLDTAWAEYKRFIFED
jgi:hypothetical protein